MTNKGRLLAGCVTALLFVYVRGLGSINFTTNQVISSHDYDQPYKAGVNKTWTWHSESGVWGIKFLDVDLTPPDSLIISDFTDPIYITGPHGRLDTSGPKLMITFQSGAALPKGRGFKLDVRHGANKADLDMKFLEGVKPPTITSPNPDMTLILPILLVIASIMLLLFFAILAWFLCSRRRRRQQQQVSLSVNVEGGIRRDSGVRYTRKPSTQSQLEDPPSPRKTTQLIRSNSNRSWMVRAELTATSPASTSTPTGGCNGNGKAHTVSNVYTPMESDRVELSGKVSVEVRDAMPGRANDVFRTRAPTLERVPEDQLLTRVPAASSLEVSQDDGYLGPSPKSPAIAYLNCPVSGSGQVAKYDFPISSRSCEDGYQNITVTGRVGIS